MQSEQVLYFSEYCFGTADAIGYERHKGKPVLRIFDLKTGESPASMHQLEVYAALFFMEYGQDLGPDCNPTTTDIDLRIYQSGEVVMATPEPNDILNIMDKIMAFDYQIRMFEHGPGNDI